MNGFSALRALLPSWKFFDDIGLVPELWVHLGGQWLPLKRATDRRASDLLINARGNLDHAIQSLLERLLREIQEGVRIETSTTYHLVKNFVEFHTPEATQFKIVAGGEDVLLSPRRGGNA